MASNNPSSDTPQRCQGMCPLAWEANFLECLDNCTPKKKKAPKPHFSALAAIHKPKHKQLDPISPALEDESGKVERLIDIKV